VFAELIFDLPYADEYTDPNDSLPDESMFLISTSDPWYGDILLYLQSEHFQPDISRDELHHICHHSQCYLILRDTLYCHGIDIFLQRCLTHDEAKCILNDYHLGACSKHVSGMYTTKKSYVLIIFGPPSSNIV
jgi:hypothetical protein